MVDYLGLLQSKKVLIGISLVVFALISIIGITALSPVLIQDTPDTFDANDVVEFSETDTTVTVRHTNPARLNETRVYLNGEQVEWNENGSVTVNKSSVSTILVETYPGNQGLYDQLEYQVGTKNFKVSGDDTGVTGESLEYGLSSETELTELNDIRWYINGDLETVGDLSYTKVFNDTGEYNITVSTTIDDVDYQSTKYTEIFRPNEIRINASVTNTTVQTYQSFDLSIRNISNNNVDNVDINWGDNTTESISTSESARHWYESSGEYTITISADDPSSNATGSKLINVTVEERDEEVEIVPISLTVYNEQYLPITSAKVSIDGGSIEGRTNSEGVFTAQVPVGRHDVAVSSDGYLDEEQTYNVTTSMGSEIILSTPRVESDDDEQDDNETTGIVINDINVTEQDTEFSDTANNTIDSGTLSTILSQTDGDGTESNPHVITDYVELQSIQVEPRAYYTISGDIDASSSLRQDSQTTFTNQNIGVGEDSAFELEFADDLPQSLDIQTESVNISSENYEVITGENNSRLLDDRVIVVFTNNSTQEAPSEFIDGIGQDDPIIANYTLSEPIYKGFNPINVRGGTINLDGNYSTISNLNIKRPTKDNIGIFYNVGSGSITNLKLSNTQIYGDDSVGILSGSTSGTVIENITVQNSIIRGENDVGGVIGSSEGTFIQNGTVNAKVTGVRNVGGIIGVARSSPNDIETSIRRSSYVNPNDRIAGVRNVGGLVGSFEGSSIIGNSYAITELYGRNNVSENLGGLVGQSNEDTLAIQSYSVVNSLSIGTSSIDENTSVGLITGQNNGSIERSYADIESTSISRLVGPTSSEIPVNNSKGLETEQMTGADATNNMDLDFESIWSVSDMYPQLGE